MVQSVMSHSIYLYSSLFHFLTFYLDFFKKLFLLSEMFFSFYIFWNFVFNLMFSVIFCFAFIIVIMIFTMFMYWLICKWDLNFRTTKHMKVPDRGFSSICVHSPFEDCLPAFILLRNAAEFMCKWHKTVHKLCPDDYLRPHQGSGELSHFPRQILCRDWNGEFSLRWITTMTVGTIQLWMC